MLRMNPMNSARVLLAAVACAALSAVAIWLTSFSATVPSLEEALSQPPAGVNTALYPADLAAEVMASVPEERSHDVKLSGDRVARYVLNKDGTTSDIVLLADGQHLVSLVDYYARSSADIYRREKLATAYSDDGVTVRAEDWYREDRTRLKKGRLDADGSYLLDTYYADGVTLESELLTARKGDSLEPAVIRDERWHSPESGHAVSRLDVLQPDGTRDLKTFDDKSRLLLDRHSPKDGIAGTYVRIYFPGTTQLHLISTSDARASHARIYREDGTLFAEQQIGSYEIKQTYYDASGTRALYRATWFKLDFLEGGKETINWVLFQVDELDSKGSTARSLTWQRGKVSKEERSNCTIDGVTYDKATFHYRLEDGTLEKVELQKADTPSRVIEHAASEGIQPSVPAAELVPPEEHAEIPVPPPERSDH